MTVSTFFCDEMIAGLVRAVSSGGHRWLVKADVDALARSVDGCLEWPLCHVSSTRLAEIAGNTAVTRAGFVALRGKYAERELGVSWNAVMVRQDAIGVLLDHIPFTPGARRRLSAMLSPRIRVRAGDIVMLQAIRRGLSISTLNVRCGDGHQTAVTFRAVYRFTGSKLTAAEIEQGLDRLQSVSALSVDGEAGLVWDPSEAPLPLTTVKAGQLVNQKALAHFLGLTTRRVLGLEGEGVIIRLDRGVYDLAASIAAYVSYRVRHAAGVAKRAPAAPLPHSVSPLDHFPPSATTRHREVTK